MSIRSCSTCKHLHVGSSDHPCCDCSSDGDRWELSEIATEAALPRNDKVGNAVDHPQHYNHGKYECIDVMVENFGKEAVKHFCLLNAFKYVWRSDYKNGTQDIKKAMWYLDKYLELEGEKRE